MTLLNLVSLDEFVFLILHFVSELIAIESLFFELFVKCLGTKLGCSLLVRCNS